MEMTMDIDESIKELSKWRKDLNYDRGDYCYGGTSTKHSLDVAINIIRKYQKIQEIVKLWEDDSWTDGISEDCMEKISEVMKDGMLIDADKLARRIAGHSDYHGDNILSAIYCMAEGQVTDVPITPIKRRKTATWIKEESPYGWDGHSYQCSECGRSIHLDTEMEDLEDYPYCHCGAKMESEDK